MNYNACREMQDVPFPEFTRRVFEQIDRTEARLGIDVRDNGGGNSAIFGPFLEALQQRRAIGQQGRLLVIVGRRTFSSAILNAMALKQDHKGILVGEPTGGRPNHYGEVRSLHEALQDVGSRSSVARPGRPGGQHDCGLRRGP